MAMAAPAAPSLWAAATAAQQQQQQQQHQQFPADVVLPTSALRSTGRPGICIPIAVPSQSPPSTPLPTPLPTPMARSQTAPPTPFLAGSDGGMQLCFTGNPQLPFADIANPPMPSGYPCRARTAQEPQFIGSRRPSSMSLSEAATPIAATPLVYGQLLGEDSARLLGASGSSLGRRISISGSPISGAPTPINVEHWATVGERLANVFGDVSMLSSPSATPTAFGTVAYTRFGQQQFVGTPQMQRTLPSQCQPSPFCLPASGTSSLSVSGFSARAA